jgi:hypothetical protein
LLAKKRVELLKVLVYYSLEQGNQIRFNNISWKLNIFNTGIILCSTLELSLRLVPHMLAQHHHVAIHCSKRGHFALLARPKVREFFSYI